jgi:hypothetical protein
LTEASTYDDQADVEWLMQVNDLKVSAKSLGDAGLKRYLKLDVMLFGAPQSKTTGGELGRDAMSRAVAAMTHTRLLSGRQVAHAVCSHLRRKFHAGS